MKKYIITALTFILASISYGQVLERQVIGSSGTSMSNANTSINFTIGEAVVGVIASSNNELSQGFWHASAVMTLSNEDFATTELTVQLFPNPVSEYLTVNFNEGATSNYTLAFYDVTGKKHLNASMLEGENQKRIDLQQLASGIYLVSITQINTTNTRTYRIIKN